MATCSHRYGSIEVIADRTRGLCHICHQEVDLSTYGRTRLYGAEAATVDHLVPQSHGGDDDLDNLMIAHHGCNASRGTRDPEEARLARAGTPHPPRSADGQALAVLGGSALGGTVGAYAFATRNERGELEPSLGGAILGAFLGALLAA